MVGARKLDEGGAANVIGEVAACFDVDHPVTDPMGHERLRMDRGEHAAHVVFHVHSSICAVRPWTCALAEVARPPLRRLLVEAGRVAPHFLEPMLLAPP